MMEKLIVEVFKGDEVVVERSGVSSKGKPYVMYSQIGYAYLDGKFPVKFKIKMKEGQSPYPVGKYYLSPLSLCVNGFEELDMAREMRLVSEG